MNLQNQTVVVMGGSSGIGLQTAQRLAKAGARVIVTGRDHDKLQRALAGLDTPLQAEVVDGRDRQALDDLFARLGGVDHLVLSLSGAEGGGEFRQLDLQALRRGFDDKFWPHVEAAQAALPSLRAGGTLTFITAISSRLSSPGVAGLGAINGALEAMVGTLARELAPSRVNAVSPGIVDTPWWSGFPAEVREAIFQQQVETLPVGRVGRPDDIAHAVQFVIENGYMTGAVIECDGGMRLL